MFFQTPLVGVEFRGVAGQQEQPQPPVGGRDELLHRAGAVGGVTVDDEEHRPVGIVQQSGAEVDEGGGC